MKRVLVLLMITMLACAAVAHAADWTAYNDCIGVDAGQANNTAPNATSYYPGQSGALKDFGTGWVLPVSVLVSVNNVQYTGGGAGSEFTAGTDAYNMFHGKVDVTNGVIYYGSSGDWNVDLVFSGLSPTASYEVGTTFDRGTYSDRWSKVSITGADSYTYASSAGAFKVGEDAVSMVSNNTANGYVAKWTDVKPGADGSFSIRHTYAPTAADIPGGASQNGNRAYGPGAFMLQQSGGPPLVHRVQIAKNHFLEQPYVADNGGVGTVNWTPGPGNTELGFTTTGIVSQGDVNHTLGPYNSSSSPHRYRVRGYAADVAFSAVDISKYWDVTVSLDMLRTDTFEAGDYFRAILSNGTDTMDLVRLEGAAINNQTAGVWYTYTADVPGSWKSLLLTVSASDNSSSGAEVLNFDNIVISGTIPEPGTLVMLAGAGIVGLALIWRRRK